MAEVNRRLPVRTRALKKESDDVAAEVLNLVELAVVAKNEVEVASVKRAVVA